MREAPVFLLDRWLMAWRPAGRPRGYSLYAREFLMFGCKEARACLFAGLFFLAVFCVPRAGFAGLPRYDLLLLAAMLIQFGMLYWRLETWAEFRALCLFHVLGFALEVFKTSAAVQSWSYPDFAYTKVWGVPLFSGFMYASVASYVIQAWRLLDLQIREHPPFWMATAVALMIYANFFTHHWIADLRWYLAVLVLVLYSRSYVLYRPIACQRRMPLLLSFVLIGFFVWLAENISTLFGVWRYPNQLGAWSAVHLGKWSSWSLLVIMTFTIVASLKHFRRRIAESPRIGQ